MLSRAKKIEYFQMETEWINTLGVVSDFDDLREVFARRKNKKPSCR